MIKLADNRKPCQDPSGAVLTPQKGIPGESRPVPASSTDSYKDQEAKSATLVCGSLAIIGQCENGHQFAKRLYCGQEWCRRCGKDRSVSHRRREARLLPKVQQLKEMGYLVIEFPDRVRYRGKVEYELTGHGRLVGELMGKGWRVVKRERTKRPAGWCYSKASLQATTKEIIEVLAGKRCGRRGRVDGYFPRGIGRWHWFGDKSAGKWNPHFNVLVESSFIEKPLLEEIKASLRARLGVPDLIVHFSYCGTPGEMVHKIRYVTRATFRKRGWNLYMAGQLYNFRNIRWWGNWKQEAIWELENTRAQASIEAVAKLQEGKCPDCGQVVDWKVFKQPIDSIWLMVWGAKEIGKAGYYRIPKEACFCWSRVEGPGGNTNIRGPGVKHSVVGLASAADNPECPGPTSRK